MFPFAVFTTLPQLSLMIISVEYAEYEVVLVNDSLESYFSKMRCMALNLSSGGLVITSSIMTLQLVSFLVLLHDSRESDEVGLCNCCHSGLDNGIAGSVLSDPFRHKPVPSCPSVWPSPRMSVIDGLLMRPIPRCWLRQFLAR